MGLFGMGNTPDPRKRGQSSKAFELINDPGGQFLSGKWKPFGESEKVAPAAVPKMDELKKLGESQRNQADLFQSQKGSIAGDRSLLQGESGRQGLAQQMAGIKQGFGGRGLLYSGMKQGSMAGAKSGLASQLASGNIDINKAVEDQGRQFDMGASETGLQMRDLQQEQNNKAYQDALGRWQARRQEDQGFGYLTRNFNPAFGIKSF